ncbi:hypothetical protein ARTHROSP310_12380 [Arthrobacter sp. AD-310]
MVDFRGRIEEIPDAGAHSLNGDIRGFTGNQDHADFGILEIHDRRKLQGFFCRQTRAEDKDLRWFTKKLL